MIVLFLILIGLPGLVVFIQFLVFLIEGRLPGKVAATIVEIFSLIVLPYLYASFGRDNICCVDDEIDTAAFSPKHQLTILVIIALALGGYIYSKFRRSIAPPVIEVLVNSSILTGIILNAFIFFHATVWFYSVFGALPVILLGIMMLAKNHRLFSAQFIQQETANQLESIAWRILLAKTFIKFPLLLVLCIPLLVLISSVLLLFGQKPDSIVRAFTETYKHGFSQWDYKCDNVDCGGHYLCSVAAKGHKKIVKPTRFGIRNNGLIICNRQLLIANAFEEILQQKFPFVHKQIRKQYNKVGNCIHRYYGVFDIKLVSDGIYFLMKPLEWIFLFILYCVDRNPENRIAKQYISAGHQSQIENLIVI